MTDKGKKTLVAVLVSLAAVVVIFSGIAKGVAALKEKNSDSTPAESTTTNSTAAVLIVDAI